MGNQIICFTMLVYMSFTFGKKKSWRSFKSFENDSCLHVKIMLPTGMQELTKSICSHTINVFQGNVYEHTIITHNFIIHTIITHNYNTTVIPSMIAFQD